MKKIFLSFITLISISFLYAQPVKLHGQLSLDSTQLVDQHGQPVVLRGMSFGWHNFWPRFYNAGVVDWLYKDWDCSVVRAAMGVEPDSGYLKDPSGSVQKIKVVVNAAIKEGIYVIIDWHSHHINMPQAKDFFIEMAKEYHTYPNVIYEIFNEPAHNSWPEVKDYAIEVITAIRAIDPDNIILVGCPHWDQDINLPADEPIMGFKNIMYTMHFYAATHKQWLRDKTDYALKKGLPVFISESAGMEASGDGKIDDEEWKTWLDWAEKRKLSWIIWSVSDKDETCSVLKKTAASTGNWKESDLKESGIKSRDYIRYFNSK